MEQRLHQLSRGAYEMLAIVEDEQGRALPEHIE